MSKLSVVINTYKEADLLPRVLESVKDIADEIVIVDMKSGDSVSDVALKYKAKLYFHERFYYVEPIRNFAISKATSDWILLLDPDEELSSTLRTKIKKIIDDDGCDYVRIPRKNIIFGKWIQHAKWWPDYNIRLFKKGHVVWSEMIHSIPVTTGSGMDLEANMENAIIHHHYDSVDQYLEKLMRYTTAQSKSLISNGYEFSYLDLIKNPMNEFVSRYFQEEGYKDGLHGFSLSLMQAFSEFITYLKVWQNNKFVKKSLNVGEVIKTMKNSESDLWYWQADTCLKEGGGFIYRLRRKLRLP